MAHAFEEIAVAVDAQTLLERTARALGDLLELDVVQVALGRRRSLGTPSAWRRTRRDDDLVLSHVRFAEVAETFGYGVSTASGEPGALSLELGRRTGAWVGLPLGGAEGLEGYFVGQARRRQAALEQRLGEALTLLTHAATALARLRTVARLQETERALAAIGEHLYVGEVTPEGDYRELHTGPGAEALLGGEVDPVLGPGETWLRAVHPDDAEVVDAFHQSLAAGEQVEVEYRLLGADGVERWVHDRAWPAQGPHGEELVHGLVRDITDRRESERRLREAEVLHTAVVEAMAEGVVVRDEQGRMISANPMAERILGLTIDQLAGRVPLPPGGGDVIREDGTPYDLEATPHLVTLRTGQPIDDMLVGMRRHDGRRIWISVTTRPLVRPGTGERYGVVATFEDVTERREADQRLREALDQAREANAALVEARAAAERLARTDMLTGIANRRHFEERLEEALREGPERVGVLVVDLDRFKRVNDTLGHAIGDEVLREVARRAGGALRTDDLLARWGGEELAVLLRDLPRPADLRPLAEAIRTAVADLPVETSDGPLAIAVSVGGAHSSLHGHDPSTLVDTADAALYAAKRGGRNLCVLAHELAPDELVGGDNDTLAIAEAVALVAANGSIDLAGRRAERVAELGARVAEELGLAAEVVHRARLGGWLRDLAGPDAEDVVRRIPALAPAARAVRHREERWDGAGVPDGLAGDAIPAEARIVGLRRRLRAGGDARGGPHRPPARAASGAPRRGDAVRSRRRAGAAPRAGPRARRPPPPGPPGGARRAARGVALAPRRLDHRRVGRQVAQPLALRRARDPADEEAAEVEAGHEVHQPQQGADGDRERVGGRPVQAHHAQAERPLAERAPLPQQLGHEVVAEQHQEPERGEGDVAARVVVAARRALDEQQEDDGDDGAVEEARRRAAPQAGGDRELVVLVVVVPRHGRGS